MIPFFTLPSKRALNVSLLLFLLVANGLLPQTLTAQCLTYQTTGLYSFTVPAGGPFQIAVSAKGGDGGDNGRGGSGATAKATFSVQAGDVLTSIVGDNGTSHNFQGGGGGGSAVILNRNGALSLLVVAGGGGGTGKIGRIAVAGGGGQGSGPATGGAGGSGSDGDDGGGGGGGLNGPGGDGAISDVSIPRNGLGGGQASLTALSAGGSYIFVRANVSGGAGFGGGGGSGSQVSSTGGGGGGYGGGNGGTGSSASQGGNSFISPTGSTSSITPGVSGGSQLQDGSVSINFPSSPVSAAITGGSTTVCAGQATPITGTVNAVGPWTIVLNDGTTQSGTGSSFSIPVTPPSSTTYSIQCLFDSQGVAQPGNVSGSQAVTLGSGSSISITGQPASSSTVCVGTNVTTFVSTSGTVSGYQWYRNGGLVSGQTSATLTLPSTTTANSGSYVVVVTGTCTSLTSTAFNLTVTPQSPDYQPLVDLYNSTNGPGWTNKTNWLTGCTPCGWYGVTCDGNGRVTALSLTKNQLSGSIPASLSALANLQTLNLTDNQLSGSIPASLSALTNLQTLNLGFNQLSGSIPASLSALTSLTNFELRINQLSGSIPASLSALTNLELLNLSQNQLSGSIPASLSALTSLTSFELRSNQLSGSIPASLSALTGLRVFNLNNNQLSGNIPSGLFSAMTNLNILQFNNNQLSGCFPASLSRLCNRAQVTQFYNNPGLPGGGDFGALNNFCRNGAGSDAFRPLATASPDPVCVGNPVSLNVSAGTAYQWSGPAGFSSTAQSPTLTATTSGLYSVTVGNGSPTCTANASVSVTVNALPTPTIGGLASAYCQDAGPQSLSGSPAGGVFTVDSSPATSFNPASLSVGQHTVVYSYTSTSGCVATTTTSANVTVNAPPSAPTLVTQSGYAYPAGVSSLTIAQNTGPVSLTVSGCSGGMLLANGNAASSFTITTAMTGTQTYTATCTQGGCTSPAGSFQLTVLPTTLSVLHKDVDYGQTQDQIIKPFLKLANSGGQPVPYGELTVRYWFTSEGNSPPTDFQLYYAQLGAVTMKYVPLTQPRQGAFGYVEYSFPGGGSLPANGNSGPIENGILKKDRSNFNETDDYSYQPNRDYLPNARITAYRNGVIVWGQEPTPVASQTAVQVYSAAKDGGITSQIQTRLELRNTGNVALPVAALKLRYYFTSDNNQTANVYVDYADLGASNVQARVVRLASPVNGADSYVELSFPGNPRQLGPLSSLGVIDFRLVRSDFGLLNQGNDYSYAPIYGPVGLNNRATVLLNNTLLFGTPPSGAPARVGALEPMLALQVTVLGNPVVGSQAQIEIRGAEGQVVNVRLVDLQGRTIHEQRIEQAGETEPVNVPLGQSRGLLLLNVSTASQQQRLKLVRP